MGMADPIPERIAQLQRERREAENRVAAAQATIQDIDAELRRLRATPAPGATAAQHKGSTDAK